MNDGEGTGVSMVEERQVSMAEKPEPDVRSNGRNPGVTANGVSSTTATMEETRPDTSQLMEAVVEKENMRRAYHRVVSNKGSAGIDEMSVDELGAHLKEHWAEIRKQLLEGTYKPQAVRGVKIPKPGKKGTRQLGIPTVVDRLIQQAGVMEGGLVSPRREGAPQGGPLSALFSDIMLDDLDNELELRGHRFCRYADDANM